MQDGKKKWSNCSGSAVGLHVKSCDRPLCRHFCSQTCCYFFKVQKAQTEQIRIQGDLYLFQVKLIQLIFFQKYCPGLPRINNKLYQNHGTRTFKLFFFLQKITTFLKISFYWLRFIDCCLSSIYDESERGRRWGGGSAKAPCLRQAWCVLVI